MYEVFDMRSQHRADLTAGVISSEPAAVGLCLVSLCLVGLCPASLCPASLLPLGRRAARA